jgi:peroxiredoxin Q/BCP
MLKLNQPAPDFQSRTTSGNDFRLSDLRGKPVALFFFPKAFTAGCTLETKQFRDAYQEIQSLGAELVGISTDNHQTQCEFASSLGVPYPMIADESGAIAGLYQVLWPLFGVSRRVTYLLDGQGIVRGVFHHELMIGKHKNQVLETLRTLAGAAPPA